MKRLRWMFGLMIIAGGVEAAQPVYTSWLNKAAVGGYDSVSFFSEGGPVKGSKDFTYNYNGVDWLFATSANLELFKAAPEKYAPQYGGYCAWAVSQNKLAPGDAKYWKIVDGKLYLNYSASVQKDWEKDIPGFIEKAEKIWPELIKK